MCLQPKRISWKSKEFIYISFHFPRSPHPTCVTKGSLRKTLRNTHVIRINWIFMPNILCLSSSPSTQITLSLKHMSSSGSIEKKEKIFYFFFCYFSILLDGKFVKWFMRSPSTDNKTFVKFSLLVGKRKTWNFPNDYLLNF